MPFKHERLLALEKYILALLAFAGLSAILNGTNAISLIAGFRMGFRYVLLFLAAYHMDLPPRWIKGYLALLFFIGMIQTPVTWLQYAQFEWRDLDYAVRHIRPWRHAGAGVFPPVARSVTWSHG